MIRFINFGSIDQFRNVVQKVQRSAHFVGLDENNEPIINKTRKSPTYTAVGTEKIHGTNAAVCYSNPDGLWVQSKNNIITPEKDNAGCAFAVEQNKDAWMDIIAGLSEEYDVDLDNNIITIYFEWCGGSIQKNACVSGLDKMAIIFKHFKVSPLESTKQIQIIEVQSGEKFIFEGKEYAATDWNDSGSMIIMGVEWQNPSAIVEVEGNSPKWYETKMITDDEGSFGLVDKWIEDPEANIYNVHNFPTYEIEIDFERPDLAQNEFVKLVEEIEDNSGVAKHFNKPENVGEGIVWTFLDEQGNLQRFKTKGDKHSNSKVKKLKEVDSEKEQAKVDFANYATPAWRLEQAWQTVFGIENEINTPDVKFTGDFIKAVIADVMKEEMDVFKEKGLEPKDVNANISKIARTWFMEELDKLAGM